MNIGRPRTSRGLRQITEGLAALDAEVFEAVANSPSPLLDTIMPALTRAADHAKLWLAIAAAMSMSGSRSARRGAGRGVVSLAATSVITNQLAKRVWRRERPPFGSVPLVRRLLRNQTSHSMPSGHSASAAVDRRCCDARVAVRLDPVADDHRLRLPCRARDHSDRWAFQIRRDNHRAPQLPRYGG